MIERLITDYCPEGVTFMQIDDVASRSSNIKWAKNGEDEFHYIDLASVDRLTRTIDVTSTITASNAPSRAQQIVRAGDVIFATTRPTQMRWTTIPDEYDGYIASTGYCVMRPDNSVILTNFLAHLLGTADFRQYVEAKQVAGNYPSIPDNRIRAYRIPVPPLEVQREIVQILDHFTALQAELEAKLQEELEARRKQYAHYRDSLMSFRERERERVRWLRMSEIGRWFGGGTPSRTVADYWRPPSIPWLSPKDMTVDTIVSTKEAVAAVALECTPLKLVSAGAVAFVVRSNILRRHLPIAQTKIAVTLNQDMRAVVPHEGILPDYVAHVSRCHREQILALAGRTDGSMAAIRRTEFLAFRIPIPPLEEQHSIVDRLDKFDALISNLGVGLTVELVARRKQYEYYRDKLLTFEEKR